jgi:alpha-1,6-mannosyltransferase
MAILSGLLLRSLLQNKKQAFWFFLNPMIILEFTGNLHFEGFTIFFVILSIWIFKHRSMVWTGITIGLAASIKLLPLIFLPALVWRARWKKGIILGFLSLVVFIASLSPIFLSAPSNGLIKSLSLYYQSFEFNASIYYLLRAVGYYFKGYNIIQTLGPRMAILSGLLIIILAIRSDVIKQDISKTLLFTLTIYLLMGTTVHPWYILPLVPLGVLSGYYYPVVWSFTAFVTYLGYQQEGYELSMWWIFLEYLIVMIFGYFDFKKYYAQSISNL